MCRRSTPFRFLSIFRKQSARCCAIADKLGDGARNGFSLLQHQKVSRTRQVDKPDAIAELLAERVAISRRSRRIFELDAKTEEGSVWQNLVLERYATWSGLKLQPVVLQQTSDAADGLTRAWARPDTGADMHRGYAFQWYALAATVLILYVVFSFKRAA